MKLRPAVTFGSLIAFTLIVAGVLFATHRGVATSGIVRAADAAFDVPLARVALGSFTERVHAQGRVGNPSADAAKLAFASSGIVSRVDVHVGQSVNAGQALAHLDTSGSVLDAAQARSEAAAATASYGGGSVPTSALTSARARLAATRDKLRALENGTGSAQSDRQSALAALGQSEAKLSTDQRALARTSTLYVGGVAALKDLEAARAQLQFDRAEAAANQAKAASTGSNIGASLATARADVAQADSDVRAAQAQVSVLSAQAASAQARYASARRALATSTLRATAAGVVMTILKQPGEAVDPSQPALVVGPPSSSDATLTASGGEARRVHVGDPVMIHLTGRDGSGIGRVRSVVPSVDPATQMSTVVVGGTPADALSGDAVEATIVVGQRRGLVIPTSAIVEDPQTGKAIVFVRERAPDGVKKFVSREISVASGDDQKTLISGGLRDGEWIAAQGAFDLLAPGGG